MPLALLLLLAVGCRNDLEIRGGNGSSTVSGVAQGGAQDFGLFRQILEDGGIPGPETIDDVGFFHEHFVGQPAPTCGDEVCLHGRLGMMGNMISGTDCTVVLLGMNTALDPEQLERPPLNLTLVVDTSGSMRGDSMEFLRTGLDAMRPALREGDRVTLVGFSETAEVLVEDVAGDDPALATAIAALAADGGTNIYDGLRVGYETLDVHADPGAQNRMILLSDGEATEGLLGTDRMVALAESWAAEGYALSTIGMGRSFDVELMRSLSEVGAGAFYFLEDSEAVKEVFVEEVEAFLVPLARDVRLEIEVSERWDLRGMYGTRLFELDDNQATVEIPSLQLAHRASDDDAEAGRRGGGGALILEMLPNDLTGPGEVAALDLSFVVPGTDELRTQQVEVVAPEGEGPWFADADTEKAFVMLNLYMGFRMAAERAERGEDGAALAILGALQTNVGDWLVGSPDLDIEDDLFYVDLFIANLEARASAAQTPEPEPDDPWPHD